MTSDNNSSSNKISNCASFFWLVIVAPDDDLFNGVRLYDSCPTAEDRDQLKADIFSFLGSQYGVPVLGLIPQNPAESCDAIQQDNPLSQTGVYWIRMGNMTRQQTCTFA